MTSGSYRSSSASIAGGRDGLRAVASDCTWQTFPVPRRRRTAAHPSTNPFSFPGMVSISCPRSTPTSGPRITIPSIRPRSTSIQ